jgi:4-diphosphocytidyl-2C-methyl-D-erythritol kinase
MAGATGETTGNGLEQMAQSLLLQPVKIKTAAAKAKGKIVFIISGSGRLVFLNGGDYPLV